MREPVCPVGAGGFFPFGGILLLTEDCFHIILKWYNTNGRRGPDEEHHQTRRHGAALRAGEDHHGHGKAFRETGGRDEPGGDGTLLRAGGKGNGAQRRRLGRGGHTGRCGTGADGKRPLRGSKAVYFVPAPAQRAARGAARHGSGGGRSRHWTACWPRSKRISPARRMR